MLTKFSCDAYTSVWLIGVALVVVISGVEVVSSLLNSVSLAIIRVGRGNHF